MCWWRSWIKLEFLEHFYGWFCIFNDIQKCLWIIDFRWIIINSCNANEKLFKAFNFPIREISIMFRNLEISTLNPLPNNLSSIELKKYCWSDNKMCLLWWNFIKRNKFEFSTKFHMFSWFPVIWSFWKLTRKFSASNRFKNFTLHLHNNVLILLKFETNFSTRLLKFSLLRGNTTLPNILNISLNHWDTYIEDIVPFQFIRFSEWWQTHWIWNDVMMLQNEMHH